MIVGIGSDITQLNRFKKFVHNKRFIDRLLTADEKIFFSQVPSQKKTNFLAKRFSGKEAFSKALGTGIGEVCSFQSLQILKDKNNAPFIEVLNSGLNKKFQFSFISFSDEKIDKNVLISSIVILEK